MRAPTFVFYISGHGFGHATRTLAVIDALLMRAPNSRIVIRSSVPEWFLEKSGPAGIEVSPIQVDTGIAQIDSLTLDVDITAAWANAFYASFAERVSAEAAFILSCGTSVVVGDVPPLAFAAAAKAAVPSIAIANFTWDWIYAFYPQFETKAPGVIALAGDAYRLATRALRLPFAGGFASMQDVARDIPLVARQSKAGRRQTRRLMSIGDAEVVVLASFGGHSTSMPYATVARRCPFTLLLTDYEFREGGEPAPATLRRVSSRELSALDLRYEDLVAAADVVVSKPGYGIVSECIANRTALLYTSRGAFAENDVIVEPMARYIRTRFISQERLRAGDWCETIETLLSQPEPSERMRLDGAEVAADEIFQLANG